MTTASLSWYSINSTGDVLTFSGDKFQVSGNVDVVDGGNYLRDGVPIFGAGTGSGEEGGVDNVALPIGSFIPYPWPDKDNDLPFGFLKCDGRYISRVAFENLFAVFGTKYGTPPPPFHETHFYIPNFSNHIVKHSGVSGNQSTDYLPVGSIFIIPWKPWENQDYPNGYLKCNGSEVPREDYPLLFSIIGNTFGTPTDNQKFVLPNIFNHGIKFKVTTDSDNGSITPWISIPGGNDIYYPEKVGIGTTDLERLFTVNGDSRLGSLDVSRKQTSLGTQTRLFISDNQATDFPGINQVGSAKGFTLSNNSGNSDFDGLSPGQFGIVRYPGSGSNIPAPIMVFEGGDNNRVGIGTTGLDSNLKVITDSSAAAAIFESDGSGDEPILRAKTTNGVGFIVTRQNYVGIGTAEPIVPLEVTVNKNRDIGSDYKYIDKDTTVIGSGSSGDTRSISIRSNASIWVDNGARFIASSDERIKREISKIDDGKALSRVRLIEPHNYKYVDRKMGTMEVFGFIAQQVREHFPEAVLLTKGFIPNIYQMTRPDFRTLSLDIPLVQSGRLKVITEKGERILDVHVQDGLVRFKKGSILGEDLTREGEIFVYGFETDDFHTLDKSYLFTLNFAATQEIDREVVRLREETEVLKTENVRLVERILELEGKLQSLNSLLMEKGVI